MLIVQSSSTESSITFQGKGVGRLLDLSLPLANTLFVNGRPSTLLKSTFKWNVEHLRYQEVDRRYLRHHTVQCFEDKARLRVPAVPLTPAREIASGLGNIVRQLKLSGGHGQPPSPASKELEANVNAYFERTDAVKAKITVWALMTKSPTGLVPHWLSASSTPELHDIGAIFEGEARLCRVCMSYQALCSAQSSKATV